MDKNLAYMTDGHLTILTLLVQRHEEIYFDPMNRQRSRLYTYEPKTYMYLTFTQKTEALPSDQMHPYTPHYFLKEQYNQFLDFRLSNKLKEPYEKVNISEWNLALVNINSTGYYAPLIVIRKFRKENVNKSPDYLALNCVLYEEWLQRQMEAYRLGDIRNIWHNKFQPSSKASMFYFLRYNKRTSTMAKNSSLVAIDFEKNLLKHSDQHEKSYVLLGDLRGTISFVNAIKQGINESKLERMNFKNINLLFNGHKLAEEESKRQKEKPSLWSDDSCSEGDEENTEREREVVNSSDSEDGEDPLKNLYVKSLRVKGERAV